MITRISKPPKMFAVLPTLLTLANLACGFGSITFAAKVGPEPTEGDVVSLLIAALLVFLAMVFDMLDGSAARWTKQTSNFGAELDSLCDAVSFGVAPAFLMLRFSHEFYQHFGQRFGQQFGQPLGRLLWVIAALYVVCAVLRLARFNVETDEDDTHAFFSGLPSPAAAGTVVSFPIALHGLMKDGVETALSPYAEPLCVGLRASLPFITFAVACLMVSRFRYVHVFNQLLRGQRSRKHLIQLVFTIAAVFLVRELAVPLILCCYALATPLRASSAKVVSWSKVAARRLHKEPQI